MSTQLDHEKYMRRALELGRQVPAFPFGTVIVRQETGTIVAEGWNRIPENPTWHGEIDAINRCAAGHRGIDWSRLVLYTTAESCPMCQSAILWAGVGTVVFGSSIRTLQSQGWWQIDIEAAEIVRRTPFARCTLMGGVIQAECDALFEAALRLHGKGDRYRPDKQ